MKYTLVLSALAALAAAADKPKFLNSVFTVSEGEPFTFKFENCDGGCTIVLQTGPSTNLKDVKTVTTTTSGGTFTWTPEGVPSGTYAFRITNNGNKLTNYSTQFTYVGTGTTDASTTASATASATEASTEASSTVKSTETTAASTTLTTATTATSASSNATTSAPTTTAAQSTTSTKTSAKPTTTIPNAGAHATPMAFVAGAIAALAYLG